MPVITAPASPSHELPGARFTSLATPSLGSMDTAVWKVEIAPSAPAAPSHRLTREEVFVVLDGSARIELDGHHQSAGSGDAIVVPAGVDFTLANGGTDPLRMLCCLPVGGQVSTPDGGTFTPPWAE
jgi:quercetin dioxygenase-like cupin family protein